MEIEIEGLRNIRADFGKAKDMVGKAGMKALQEVGLEIVAEAKLNLKRNRTTNKGALSASGKVQKDKDGGIDAGFFSKGSSEGYAAAVEYGRGPSRKKGAIPLRETLKAWVRRKLGGRALRSAAVFNLMDEEGNLVRKSAKDIKKSEEELIEAAALAISRKIHKHGTKAQPFFVPAVKKFEDKIQQYVDRYIKKEIK